MNAPIIIFGYKRIEKLKRCLAAVEKASVGLRKELYIYIDGNKDEYDRNEVIKTQEYAKNYDSSVFSSVTVNCRKHNVGLAESIICGVTDIINKFGAVIVVEDDLIVSKSFVSYCDAAINKYENDSRIWSIGGWIPSPMENYASEGAFLSLRAECWGWATWKDRWNSTDWEIDEYWGTFRRNLWIRRKFNRAGNDMAHMLDEYFEGENHSWAIRWAYSQWKQGMYTICPRKSLVLNVGFDGQGTNCHIKTVKQDISSEEEMIPDVLNVDKKIIRYYYHSVGTHGIRRIVRSLKWGIHILLVNEKHSK